MGQTTKRKSGSEPDTETTTKNPKDLEKEGEEIKKELEDLVDEIDDVLEENAEEFVKNYVQRGGQ